MDPPAETGRPAQDEPTPPLQKKRRIQTAKACERCRVKKIRCDGTAGSDVKCSHCRTANATCVFTESPKERPRGRKHVPSAVEARLERLEALLGRIHPEVDTSALDDLPPHAHPRPSADPPPVARIVSHASSSSTHRDNSHRIDDDDGDDEDEDEDRLAPPAADPALDAHQDHLFGTSSGVQLLQRVLNLKAEGTGMHYNVYEHLSNSPYKRPDFWETHPWASPAPSPSYHFPDPDLLPVLVDNFFRVPGIIFPILHRPTFAQQLADGLHHADDAFANVLLLVCAIGAMWLDDPRVYVRGPDNVQHPHSAGWPWFNQVQLVRNTALIDPCLRDLQICALAGVFMHASCPPQTCWTLIGVGLRVMQDLGAHRRQTYVGKSPVEAELWKRAFWVLLTLDTWLSSFLGRPCALSIENVDVDLPTDCDDEYWAHPDPTRTLRQPPGIPSMISFPIAWFRLHVIHAHALQTIYSTDKQRIIAQIGRPEWERRTVAELDAALNKWFDSIPDHLRWNPSCANNVHFFGAVSLLSGYYLVQMTIHRSFIRSSHKKSALSFQSLTLCVNAARACSHVLEVALLRQPGPTPSLLIPAFMSGIVLLLGMWTAKRTGIAFDMERETHNVRNCVKFIRTGEHRWPTARRLINLLRNLSAAGDLPATESPMPTTTASTRKRARSPDPQTSNASFLAPALASSSASASRSISPPAPTQPGLHDLPTPSFGPPGPPEPAIARSEPSTSASASASASLAGTRVSTRAILVPLGSTSGLGRASDKPPRGGRAFDPNSTSNASPPGPPLPPTTSAAFDAPPPPPPALSLFGMGASGAFQDMFGPMAGAMGMGGTFEGAGGAGAYGSVGSGGDGPGAVDPLVNYFASLAPQDGQMDVDSGMMALWSTLPDSFQTEDWDTYVSNLVDIGTEADGASGRASAFGV